MRRVIGFIFPSHPLTQELFDILSDELEPLGFDCKRLETVVSCRQQLCLVMMFGLVPSAPSCNAILEELYSRKVLTVLWEIEALPPAPLGKEAMASARLINRALEKKGLFCFGLVRSFTVKFLTYRLRRQTFDILQSRYGPFTGAAVRLMCRIYQWMYDAHASGRIKDIWVSVHSRSDLLRQAGLPSSYRPVGYHKRYGELRSTKSRDINVLFLGGVSPARSAALARLSMQLKEAGHSLTIVSGGLRGEERTRLLNRTKILLNVLNHPWEFPGIRLLMGMGCGCLVVSQSAPDTHPYRPGEHFAMADTEAIGETLIHYLENETERSRVAMQGHRFVTREMTMRNSIVDEILNLVER